MTKLLTLISLLLLAYGIGTSSMPVGFAGTALLGWVVVRGEW